MSITDTKSDRARTLMSILLQIMNYYIENVNALFMFEKSIPGMKNLQDSRMNSIPDKYSHIFI